MITCSDGQIFAHKLVLASISPMLYSEFKQNIWDEMLSIILPNYSLQNEDIFSFPNDVNTETVDNSKMMNFKLDNIVKRKKSRKGTRRGALWQYFTLSPDLKVLCCNLCSKQYSYSPRRTTSYLDHLYIHDIKIVYKKNETRSWKCQKCPRVYGN